MAALPAIQQVSDSHLSILIGTDTAVVIDTRGTEFHMSHIPGSVHVPATDFTKRSRTLIEQHGRSGKMLVLVGGDSVGSVNGIAAELMQRKMELTPHHPCAIGILAGGFRSWEKRYATHPLCRKFITRGFSDTCISSTSAVKSAKEGYLDDMQSLSMCALSPTSGGPASEITKLQRSSARRHTIAGVAFPVPDMVHTSMVKTK